MGNSHKGAAAHLSEAKRRLLEQRLRGGLAPLDPRPGAIPRRPSSGPSPLSFGQERLWFLNRLQPGSSAYNETIALELSGPLQVAALHRALARITRRHEVLRSRLELAGDRPVQRPLPAVPPSLPSLDLGGLGRAEPLLRRLLAREARRPFDLARGPLIRFLLVRRARREHVLVLSLHHAVFDTSSFTRLVEELAELYLADLQGRSPALAELPIQYADYAAWQRQDRSEEEAALAYWRRRLERLPALELPADRPRPPVQSLRGGRRLLRLLDVADRGALHELGRSLGATSFMVLLTGFKALLHRYSGQGDLAVGIPITLRDRPELEGLIGFFTNSLVVRTRPSGTALFAELVGRVRKACLEAYVHQQLPFERLVEELRPARDLSRSPLFQHFFQLQPDPAAELRPIGPLQLAAEEIDNGSAKFDLTVHLYESRDGVQGFIEYSRDLFDAVSIERLGHHLTRLTRSALAGPERAVAELPLMSAGETHQIRVERNDTWAMPLPPVGLEELFAARARSCPDRVALVEVGREGPPEAWTYAGLDRWAGEVARRLRGLGAHRGDRVGLCLGRRPVMVAALLGTLRAGCAHLPLDPSYPRQRLAFLARDGDLTAVLTRRDLRPGVEEWWEADPGRRLEVLDDLPSSTLPPRARGEAGPRRPTEPAELAYLIYTSGTTGTPKGVAVCHGSAVRLVSWALEVFTPRELDGVLASSSFNFDLSIFELFVPLAAGGRVVLAEDVLTLPWQHGARLVNTVPSALASLLRAGGLPASVITVNLAGEPLAPALVEELYQQPGVERVLDLYGPSEATIYSTFTLRRPGEPAHVGRPIAATRAWVLDRRLRPVPDNVPGELHLAGEGLARGYWRRSAGTAERFLPDPFSLEPGGRLYRTGDRARWLPAGRIQLLGRLDSQVKVRGVRVELGEVEAALAAHPEVGEVAVLLHRGEQPGHDRLVAYLAVSPGLAVETLREFLAARLPAAMIPSRFVPLERLPRTPGGKLDRRALPSLDGTALGTSRTPTGRPRTPIEMELSEIWATVLATPQVGLDDGFFALGGHSLLAVQLVSNVQRVLGVDLPVDQLFRTPTVRTLGRRVQELQQVGCRRPAPEVASSSEAGADPPQVSWSQERYWHRYQADRTSPLYNVPSAARLRGRLDGQALACSITEIVRRHQVLRTALPAVAGRPSARVIAPRPVPLPVVDLTALGAEDRRRQAERQMDREVLRPFDLDRGALLRALHLRLQEDEQIVLITVHHIAIDYPSTRLLWHELAALYDAFRRGCPSPLPPPQRQYRDFAAWQRQRLTDRALAEQVQAVCRRLLPLPPLLPFTSPDPGGDDESGAGIVVHRLPAGWTARARALGRRYDASLFMTFLALLDVVLARHAGVLRFLLSVPIVLLPGVEFEGTIGCFSNLVLLCADLTGTPRFSELLARVREDCLSAYALQDTPYPLVRRSLETRFEPGRSELFSVELNSMGDMVDHRALPATLGDLALESVPPPDTGPLADLTLYVLGEGDELSLHAVHCRNALGAAETRKMLREIELNLEVVSATPEIPIRELLRPSNGPGDRRLPA